MWGSKDEARSCQVNGEIRRCQNLKDFVRDREVLLNCSHFTLCCMEMTGFVRDLMRKNEAFNCCSAQDHTGISREAWERIQLYWLHLHWVF